MSANRPAVFYSFRRCPYAMRARLAIRYSQVEVELREVVLKDKPTSLLAYSPKGTVPVLVTNDKQIIDESRDIMQWALSQNDSNNWLRKNLPQLQKQITSLIDENDNEFKAILDKYKYADRHPEYTEAVYREQGCHFLNQLELLLTLHSNLIDEEISLADIAIFPFIRQFASVDKDWFSQSPYPKLRTWLTRHTSSPLFTDIMYKYPQWSAGDKAVYFASAS
ncbi:putative glutathione S-transferase [Moritella sp. JT01]|uniref:glutathione S-transferase n=1 Tax=Moritella sp. JT01 TaxID=756698 RepID=UPI00079439B2|nr:glutathione S-transferase [Moritella sp. JT01]KXO12773.1 putative glutathione S-transferase [Moritella sp. JT01]